MTPIKSFSASLACLLLLPATASAEAAVGTWKTIATDQGHLEIRIAPCGARYCGTITRARDHAGKVQPFEYVGRKMIWDMKPSGAGKYDQGRIWDPRNGKTFKSRMAVQGNTLTVSGCVLGVCQSQQWTRLTN